MTNAQCTCGTDLCPGDVLCSGCGAECDPDETLGFKIKRELNRGETVEIEYDLVDRNSAPVDLSLPGVKVWFTVKDYLVRADSQALWQGTLSSGIDLVASTAGKIRVVVPAATSQHVPDGIVKLYYDLRLLDALGRTTVIEKGLFLVAPSVTKTIA